MTTMAQSSGRCLSSSSRCISASSHAARRASRCTFATSSGRAARPEVFDRKNNLAQVERLFAFNTDGPSKAQESASEKDVAKKQPTSTLSPEQALYLAKEAGFYTRTELQDQILRSPSFSRHDSPFLMDRFLDPLPQPTLESHEELIEEDDLGANFGLHGKQPVPRKIHETLRRATGCTTPAGGSSASSTRSASKTTLSSFIDSHTGNEWLSYAEGRGTRLRAAAHCVLRRGTGVIKVNGEEDLASRWPLLYNRMELCLPFYVAEACCLFDVFLAVKGGGPSGQAGACRLAVARALATARPACVPLLNSRQLLFEDLRNKLPKDPRRPKARANWRWSKR